MPNPWYIYVHKSRTPKKELNLIILVIFLLSVINVGQIILQLAYLTFLFPWKKVFAAWAEFLL